MTAFYTQLEDGLIVKLLPLLITKNHLTWAMYRANDYKAAFNTHLASTDYHTAADTVNPIVAADASDLATLITLLTEFRTNYEAHRVLVGGGPVHGTADAANAITAAVPTDLESCLTLVKDIILKYEAHRKTITGSPTVHLKADTVYIMVQYVKMIAPFGGNYEDIVDLKAIIKRGAPAIFVQAQGATPIKKTVGGLHYRDARVAAILIDRSPRSQGGQRRGSGHGGEPPGIYQMIEDACDLVVGKLPVDVYGNTIQAEHWRIFEERQIYSDKDFAVWVLLFGLKVAHTWSEIDRATLNDFDRADGEGDLYVDGVKVVDALEMLSNNPL